MSHILFTSSSQRLLLRIIAFFLLLSFCNLSNAQKGLLSIGQQGDSNLSIPQNGQKAERVLQQFGEPKSQSTAVGEPPISQWEYNQFTVYFENDRVIHAVLHNQQTGKVN